MEYTMGTGVAIAVTSFNSTLHTYILFLRLAKLKQWCVIDWVTTGWQRWISKWNSIFASFLVFKSEWLSMVLFSARTIAHDCVTLWVFIFVTFLWHNDSYFWHFCDTVDSYFWHRVLTFVTLGDTFVTPRAHCSSPDHLSWLTSTPRG